MTPAGLYVHIPFCDARCTYCDFVTFTDRHRDIDRYLDALAFEMSLYGGRPIQTIFIGGGTPSVLSPGQLERLFGSIRKAFDTSLLGEVTMEANPESATSERLSRCREFGVNRLSFGLQATQNRLLQSIGRLHSFERFQAAYAEARAAGFDNINVDLMFGLPNQSMEDWKQTVDVVVALDPEHVSMYALKVEPGTKLGATAFAPDGDLQADMYLYAAERFTAAAFQHYEISNFSKPGRASRHNRLYWENEETIGVGVGAATYVDGRRKKNRPHLPAYLADCLARRAPAYDDERLDADAREREDVILHLRLADGVDAERLARLGVPLSDQFVSLGLARRESGRYRLTPQGWLLSNRLFQEIVADSAGASSI